jgi:hypothetical protein
VGRQGRRGARKLAWDYTTSTLLSASIHPTLENFEILRTSPFGCSPKFASSLRDLYDAVAQGEHERLQLGVHPKL